MASERLSHGGQHLFRKGLFLAGTKPRKQRRRQCRNGDRFLQGLQDGPASLTGVLYIPLQAIQLRVLLQRVPQARRDTGPAHGE